MRQRNTSGSPLVLPTLDPPVEVLPGDEIDFPDLLAGMEVVENEQSTVAEPVAVPDMLTGLPPLTEDDDQAAPSAETDEEVSQ